jgi:hypothetical protein
MQLVGTGDKGARYDYYILDFDRWGTGGATPRFRNSDNLMIKAVEFAEPVHGREHHANWFQSINHPDALLIAAAPELFEACAQLLNQVPITDQDKYEAYRFAKSAINKALGKETTK